MSGLKSSLSLYNYLKTLSALALQKKYLSFFFCQDTILYPQQAFAVAIFHLWCFFNPIGWKSELVLEMDMIGRDCLSSYWLIRIALEFPNCDLLLLMIGCNRFFFLCEWNAFEGSVASTKQIPLLSSYIKSSTIWQWS